MVSYCERMKQENCNRAIVVVRQGITPLAKQVRYAALPSGVSWLYFAQAIAEMAPRLHLEQFNESELLVNITEHQLVPKHIRLTREEKKELLDK